MYEFVAHRDRLVQVRDALLERTLRLEVVRVLLLAERLGLRARESVPEDVLSALTRTLARHVATP